MGGLYGTYHLLREPGNIQDKNISLVIQAVPFLSPIVGGHLTPWKGHVNSPSQKGHGLNHLEVDFDPQPLSLWWGLYPFPVQVFCRRIRLPRGLKLHRPPEVMSSLWLPSGSSKHSNGKSPFSIGNTSSNGGLSIAMLDYRRVSQISSHQREFLFLVGLKDCLLEFLFPQNWGGMIPNLTRMFFNWVGST